MIWIADSLEALSDFPREVKRSLGFALRQVQNGETPEIAKPLRGLGTGVYELKEDGADKTFRVVYLLKLKSGVYVIDAFVKKSKTGIGVPREIAARIEKRIRFARQMDKES